MQNPFLIAPSKGKLATLLAIGCAGLLALGGSSCKDNGGNGGQDTIVTTDSAAIFAFANSVTPPPPGAKNAFQLSWNYPSALPQNGSEMPWLQLPVDFTDTTPDWKTGPWGAYMQSILDYVKEGQDPNLTDEAGYQVNVKGSTRWFNMPWMAYNGSSGREWRHGCTNERSTHKEDLDGDGVLDPADGMVSLPLKDGKTTPIQYETWAVGFYNDFSAYNIGQVIPTSGPNAGVPQLDEKGLPKGLPFAVGTCVMKLLFTAADSTVAPYLANSPKWMVDRHVMVNNNPTCARSLQPVRLIQMDVAVVDPRAPMGWVYGTFVYNGTLPGATIWDRMAPLGIQYGNDPTRTPVVASKAPVFQSVINPQNIYEHLGCNARLCGPADNKLASCLSCHAGAYTAPMNELDEMGTNIPPIFGFPGECTDVGSADNVAYFSNRKFPEPYYKDMYPKAIPLDFSLQLWVAFSTYKTYKIKGSDPCTLGK